MLYSRQLHRPANILYSGSPCSPKSTVSRLPGYLIDMQLYRPNPRFCQIKNLHFSKIPGQFASTFQGADLFTRDSLKPLAPFHPCPISHPDQDQETPSPSWPLPREPAEKTEQLKLDQLQAEGQPKCTCRPQTIATPSREKPPPHIKIKTQTCQLMEENRARTRCLQFFPGSIDCLPPLFLPLSATCQPLPQIYCCSIYFLQKRAGLPVIPTEHSIPRFEACYQDWIKQTSRKNRVQYQAKVSETPHCYCWEFNKKLKLNMK